MWRTGLIGLTAAGGMTQPAPQTAQPSPPPAAEEAPPPAQPDERPEPPPPSVSASAVGPFQVGMDMTAARAVTGFRFEDGRTGEEGAIPIVTAFLGDERFVTLWPSDGKVGKIIARSPTLVTAEGVAPGMKASEVLAKLDGEPEILVACEDSEGTSIKVGTHPYELIFGDCGLDSVRKADSVLLGIAIP